MSIITQDTALGTEPADDSVVGRSVLALAWRRIRRDRVAIASAAVIVVIALLAIAAPLVAHVTGWTPTEQDRVHGITATGLPTGPSTTHWLGTDNLGRDILVRTVYGARVSLVVGVLATALATLTGVTVGIVAGYGSVLVDTVLSRFMDIVLSFPFLLFAIALVSIVGPSFAISVVVITFFSWAGISRVMRGQTLSLREKEFVEAARMTGAGTFRILTIEILPNLISPMLVLATLLVPTAIVFEATLSFLGLGVAPPTPTWGNMISDSLPYYSVAWWFVAVPGLALLLLTLAFNLLGDAVRDALDPGAQRLIGKGDRA